MCYLSNAIIAFGVSLEVLLVRDKPEDGIPRVVKDLATFIEEKGSHSVGIFRIPGTATTIKRVKTLYNQSVGEYPNLFELEQFKAEDAAGVFKMFFRDMPEPLIPHDMYQLFISMFPHGKFES